ncbi:MAG: YbhB/YbcL family Raf kinase inhibitor-like protein [Betaproteobacteria bacterium]|nr:YbhB/YbcL family Raf kinase inhibitor-like protein [Betaproteobacteria bacterium]
MKLSSPSFTVGQAIPGAYAFCVPSPKDRVTLSSNRNPALRWDNVPEGTKSFVLICHDPDVPSKGDDVNQPDRTVPASLPRVDFFHWVLVDIPADMREIRDGEYSQVVTPRGKPGPATHYGARHGVNDYTGWFASDANMAGDYYGYDGPCPPWNDEIAHHYVFTLYALDIACCPVEGRFTGADVRRAIGGHVLAKQSIAGKYTLNPDVAI